ncbi:septum site-determining protein MinC [Clostridium bornimense]|uniref:septum site-determining protein MinC n=1 Tax=Clostridium bornimense TaxID=1216932 RepID=UPI001C10E16F|nr:septum site-determining protein MinC [Clostridium bornimense]MBU5317226.1 septum site-determining protein MinC [Clostridium bornimense]
MEVFLISRKITLKGNKDGLNAIIDMSRFASFDEMMTNLVARLNKGKRFFKGSTLIITSQLRYFSESEMRSFKNTLFSEFEIKDCIFRDSEENTSNTKVFQGIKEGKTKFIRNTIRSGQIVRFDGNLIIIGDINPGAEVYATGNIVVLGILRGDVHAGSNGNKEAIIAAFSLQPKIIQIANMITRSPDDVMKPNYPEVAKIKGNFIIVEPYSPNKFI